MSAAADRASSIDLIMAAGQYAVTVQSSDGSTPNYRIGLAVMTDPVGAQPTDPTTNPQPASPPPPPTTTSTTTATSPPTYDGGSASAPTTSENSSAGDTSTQTTTWWGSTDTDDNESY
jgi:hypothetical protein